MSVDAAAADTVVADAVADAVVDAVADAAADDDADADADAADADADVAAYNDYSELLNLREDLDPIKETTIQRIAATHERLKRAETMIKRAGTLVVKYQGIILIDMAEEHKDAVQHVLDIYCNINSCLPAKTTYDEDNYYTYKSLLLDALEDATNLKNKFDRYVHKYYSS